mmetsp:Transcript_5469/g.12438  ORF Transcript_5469/g.12438 Transcript_5469/m.12438 type:complete len:172 (+) Transcript_5469:1126-1641(+)
MLHRIRRQEKKALALTDSTYATVSRSNEIVNSARAGKSGFTAFLGHITFDLSRKTFGRIHDVLKLREISNFPPSERIGNTDDPESNDQHVYEEETAHQHSHKPKKDGVLQTKQQLRQQKRLKHNQDNVRMDIDQPKKAYHRWYEPDENVDGVWHHTLAESDDELDDKKQVV